MVGRPQRPGRFDRRGDIRFSEVFVGEAEKARGREREVRVIEPAANTSHIIVDLVANFIASVPAEEVYHAAPGNAASPGGRCVPRRRSLRTPNWMTAVSGSRWTGRAGRSAIEAINPPYSISRHCVNAGNGSRAQACELIALSIVFLASELVRGGARHTVARSYPWLVAFTFGLLHGLGFAGALAEVGRDPGAAHPPRADAARHPRRISRRRRRWPLYTFGATTVAATARNANI
jgi:hypothetical protein